MLTFQDLLAVGNSETKRAEFLLQAIAEHENSEKYKIGQLAAEFYAGNDPILEKVEKLIYDLNGIAHRNYFAANHKIMTNFYQFFVMQTVSYSFGNGVAFDNEAIKKKLGTGFDKKITEWVKYAINDGEAYVYVTENSITPMSIGSDKSKPIFIPFVDEETGAIKAGLRYWQLNSEKPLRITLYEPQGYTEYKQPYGEKLTTISDLKPYKSTVTKFDVYDDIIAVDAVEGLPVVKLSFINDQSYLKHKVSKISAYNALESKLVNNSSEADIVYWVLKNCGGMDDFDDSAFLMKVIQAHVAHLDDGQEAEPKQLVVPHEGILATLETLRKQMFYDFAAIDFDRMAGGNITQMEIKQAYANKDLYADDFEMSFTESMESVLKLMGYEGETFHLTRSKSINVGEMSQIILAEAPYFGEETTTKRLCEAHGMIDSFEEIQSKKLAEIQSLTPMMNGGDVNAADDQAE